MKWSELSMTEKNEVIKMAVAQGIKDISSIKNLYEESVNGSRRFEDGGGLSSLPSNWTMQDEAKYRNWKENLPVNLRNTNDNDYDMRRAYLAGMQPVLEDDGYYHLGSRDPKTGRILKAPHHPTYLQAINTDARIGYYPTIDKQGVTYTNTWKGNKYEFGGPKRDRMPAHPRRGNEEKDPEAIAAYQQYESDMAERRKVSAERAKQYIEEKARRNIEAAKELNRRKDIVMSQLEDEASSIPFTGQDIQEAAEEQRQEKLDKWRDYKKGINATITAAELGLSGASLLGAYANWRNWATAANATKRGIANLLQRAQLPMQVTGTAIDGYQTYDADSRDSDFDTYYNGASGTLGVAGSLGAADLFNPKVDRVLDVLGIIQNSGDFLKFGYDSMFGNKKAEGGSIHIAPNFARNASKWKHGLGGNLFSGEENHNQRMITTGGAGYVPPVSEGSLNKFKEKVVEASKKAMFYAWDIGTEGFKNPFTYDWSSSTMDNYESGTAQDTFLLPRKLQEEQFLKAGYIKGEEGDYGLVKKAVGKHNYPVYQTAPDAISRDKLIALGNTYTSFLDHDVDLKHEGSAPSAIYTDGHGNFYQKRWDLNDYGGSGGSTASIAGRLLDAIGSPTVITTGYQPFGFTDNHPYYVHDLKPMMAKKGLVPIEIDGKTEWTLPEVTVVGKRKKQR